MPLRVKSRPAAVADAGLRSPSPSVVPWTPADAPLPLPEIAADDSFRDVIKQLAEFMSDAVVLPCTFEQLRTTSAGDRLRALVTHLAVTCDNPCIVNALLALKWHYGAAADGRGLAEARASACEIVAWRFLTHLSERDAVDFCLYEIPGAATHIATRSDEETLGETSPLLGRWTGADVERPTTRSGATDSTGASGATGSTGAGSRRYQLLQSISRLTMTMRDDDDDDDDPTAPFVHLNALEIAAVADAKRFLAQNVVQKIVTGIWNGDIVFWDRLAVDAIKRPRFYVPHGADVFARLRVPKYLKVYEALFFFAFLVVFYVTLVQRRADQASGWEVAFFFLLAAFAYDELSEWHDAGSLFYVYDVWNLFDLVMIAIGVVFAALRAWGLATDSLYLADLAFDILSLEALFMVPRIGSILSLSPYWGTLIPCFKEMTKDFVKFMVLVVVIYVGFLTTFSLLARDVFTLPHMTMILTKIFYGSSYVGFDVMDDIDPVFGPPLMFVFVTMSTFLLMGSLTGMLSNSFSRVMGHAREEYLYVYSIYVLEASTSNRLTHFYPPFNLLALVCFRPLRLFLPADRAFRAARIALLKATHLPVVAPIQAYEWLRGSLHDDARARFSDISAISAIRGPKNAAGERAAPSAFSHAGGSIGTASHPLSSHRKRPALPTRLSTHSQSVSQSVSQPPSRPATATPHTPTPAADEDTGMDAPSDVEVRISELSAKIDQLVAVVLSLQEQQQKQST